MGKKHRSNDWDQGGGHSPNKNNGRQEASKEDLSEYIHSCSPGILVVIISLLMLLVATIVWGFAGTLPVTETVTGLVVDRDSYLKRYPDKANILGDDENVKALVLCFVDASRFNGQAIKEFGDDAVLKMPDQNTFRGKIETRYMVPMSMDEAKELLFDNEWVQEQCVKQNYNWMLTVQPTQDLSQYAFTLAEVTLLTEEVPPIRLLVN